MIGNDTVVKDADTFFREAFVRNIGLLSEAEQAKLRRSSVGIVGVGGVGGFHLLNLVRMGVGEFHIADMESFEVANIQRQCGAFMDTMGKNKAHALKDIALAINPHVKITVYDEAIASNNVDDFFSDVDVFIDGIEFFSIDARRLIFKKAYDRGIYAITAGPLGFGSALLIFSPEGMSFDEYFDINDRMSYEEKIIAFGVGLAPAALQMKYVDLEAVNLRSRSGPSLVSACSLCSSLAVTEVLNILLKRKELKCAPFYFQFDPYLQQCRKGYLAGGNRNLMQRLKRWYLVRRFSKNK